VLVVDELVRSHHSRVGQAGPLELLAQAVDFEVLQRVGELLQEPQPQRDPLGIGGEARVLGEIGPLEQLAQDQELPVAHGADEQLRAVCQRERIVDAPGGRT
jgi:hypothetical protein